MSSKNLSNSSGHVGKSKGSRPSNFKCLEEFQQWKAKIEEENVVNYVHKSTSAKTSLYYCHRSLKSQKSREKGTVYKRSLKIQGSCKMENSCTSQITVHKENGKLCVYWQTIHYGHGRDLQHIRLTNNEKLTVASKLISGVRPIEILHSVRDNIGEQVTRLDLLTSKDIANVKKKIQR